MNEEQAQTMINLLVEISTKLTDISDKIASDYDADTVCGKLGDVVKKLDYIDTNTSN